MDIKPIYILEAIRRFYPGTKIPKQRGVEVSIHCFAHDDQTASMSVNTQKGTYNCHACGASGNIWTFLMKDRGMSGAEAREWLMNELHAEDSYVSSSWRDHFKEQNQSEPKPLDKLTAIYPRKKDQKHTYDKIAARYEYLDKNGKMVMLVVRYEAVATGKSSKPPKSYNPYTPVSSDPGCWWGVSALNERVPKEDRIRKYPLYNLADLLKSDPKRRVHIVEGEKCVEILKANLIGANGVPPLVVSLYGGSKQPLKNHDLSPLFRRDVWILADADENGREFAKRLGQCLVDEQDCNVQYLLPPGEDKHDAGDVVEKFGMEGWLRYVGNNGSKLLPHSQVIRLPPEPEGETQKKVKPRTNLEEMARENPYFRILGMFDENIIIQKKGKAPFTKIFRPQSLATPAILTVLASDGYWRTIFGGMMKAPQCNQVLDAIVRRAEDLGQVPKSKLSWGRGAVAARDGSDMKYAYNLGHSVLVEGSDGLLSVERELSDYTERIFSFGDQIKLKDNESAAKWSLEFANAVASYRWERYEDGCFFLGWIVSSLVGGALQHRPFIWLTAPTGTGKTFLMNEIMRKLLENTILFSTDPTAAGIAQEMNGDSLPLVLDEAETETGLEHTIRAIMNSMRSATSGEGGMKVRGAPGDQPSKQMRIRYSMLCASINTPSILNAADRSRMVHIRLSETGVENWPEVREEIYRTTNRERCQAILTHIIRHARHIAETTRILEEKYVNNGYPTRQAQILGALSAGYGFLIGNKEIMLNAQIAGQDSRQEIYQALMNAKIRLFKGATIEETIGEAIAIAMTDPVSAEVNVIQRSGFRVHDDGLLVAVRHVGMQQLLRHTDFQYVDLENYFKSIPGVEEVRDARNRKGRVRFSGTNYSVLLIPRDILEEWGPLGSDSSSHRPAPESETEEIPF